MIIYTYRQDSSGKVVGEIIAVPTCEVFQNWKSHGEDRMLKENHPSRERYWVQDCSAATENILLAGTSLGLGTVWLGLHPRPERKERLRPLLGILDNIEILSIVALGYPAEKKPPRTQFDARRVHHEGW